METRLVPTFQNPGHGKVTTLGESWDESEILDMDDVTVKQQEEITGVCLQTQLSWR